MDLDDVIPNEDFRFSMRFRKGAIADFYGKTTDHEDLTALRRQSLDAFPDRHAALLDAGIPILEEATTLAVQAGGVDRFALQDRGKASSPTEMNRILGAAWEPDFLLLKSVDGGLPRLLGGCVCFPSHWSLEEKIGRTIDMIHAPVPGLNAALSRPIGGFLNRIQPEVSWERANWGLAATPALNLHPACKPPRLHSEVDASEVWLRIEQQSLVGLPETGGVLFGIRLDIIPLTEITGDPSTKQRLFRALQTMPADMARYKGLVDCRQRLLDLLSV